MLLSITEFIGRFHPLLVHLPIGILLLALLLQWLSSKEQFRLPQAVLKLIWLCGTFTALLSCITGYLLSLKGDYDVDTVAVHMWLGIAVAAVSLFICAKVFSAQFDAGYKIAIISLLLVLLGTGHFGGSLTHGSDYLTAAFSNNDDLAEAPQKIIPNIQEATVYADIIQPILQSKCYSCHGTKKQKGGLRVDDPQLLMKGGKDGEVIFPGKAEESELVKRLLLAREDEDHMPPKRKPQLNERQIALLHWWVEQGADFTKKVKEIPQPEKIKPMLAALQGPAERKAISTVPELQVEPADEKTLKIVRDRGVVIMPVAQNSNYLMANFVTATDINDVDIKLLLPLKKQLVWLKLGNTKISDSGMVVIGQCSNIILLQLNNTNITDKGIAYLKSLNELQSLNLVGTKITANGLLNLHSLKKLTSVFLYQTNIPASDWTGLKNAFPKTMLDTGGYKVPFLPTDTILVEPKKK